MDIFLSYNSRDRGEAVRIAEHLRAAGGEVYLDRWQLAGVEWMRALEDRLARCNVVVVLIGPHGMGGWQLREVHVALDRGVHDELPIVPVLLPGGEPPLGFLALRTWVDLRENPQESAGLALLLASVGIRDLDEVQKERQLLTQASICPYRGLQAFREEDAAFYFGREADVERLRQALEEYPIATVVGASGCGKSSLVRAGLIPELRRERSPTWEIATIHPHKDPLRTLAATCWPLLEDVGTADEIDRADWMERLIERLTEQPSRLADQVDRILEKQAGNDRLLLFVDQAEELFTTSDDGTRGAFLEAITIAAARAPLWVVLALRADFVGNALEDRWLKTAAERNFVPISAMSPESLEEAIQRPAEAASIEIDPYLSKRIVEDLEGEPGNLPLLEFALTELWKSGEGQRLRTTDYDAFGGVQNVIAKRAESLCEQLTAEENNELRGALLRMVRPGAADTRRQALWSEIPPGAQPVVQQLVNARLLVTGRTDGLEEATVEAAHEALITNWDRLRDWIEADRQFLLWQERLRTAQTRWITRGRTRDELWNSGQLAEASRWVSDNRELANNEFLSRSFLARSRRQQAFFAVIAVIFALSVVAGLLAWEASSRARELRSQAIITTAKALHDPTVAGLLLVSLRSIDSVRESQSAIAVAHQIVSQRRAEYRFPDIHSASLSLDGRLVATGSSDGAVKVWNLEGGSQPIAFKGHSDEINSVNFSATGRRVVSASADGTVRVWSSDGQGEPIVLEGHTDWVWDARFSADEQWVVSASKDDTVRVWSTVGSSEPVVLEGHTGDVTSATFSPDGKRVISASDDETVRMWSADGSGEPVVLRGDSGWLEPSLTPDGRYVVILPGDGSVQVWSADGSGEPVVLEEVDSFSFIARFSPDGRHVVSGSVDGQVKVWNADGSGEPVVLKGDSSWISEVRFSPDGREIVSASFDGTVRVWSADGQGEPVVLRGHSGPVWPAGFSSDGRRIFSVTEDGSVRVWSLDNGTEPFVFRGHTDSVRSVQFSPDGRRIVSASEDGTVRVWNVDGSDEPIVFRGHTEAVRSVRFSPDGRRVVSASNDHTVRVWKADGNEESVVLKGHTGWVRNAEFSSDGQRVVAGSKDGTVRVWRADGTGEPVVLRGQGGEVYWTDFSPDDRWVVAGSEDGAVRIWNEHGTGDPIVLEGHTNKVWNVRFSPDGQRLVSASEDGTVRVWSSDGTGEPVELGIFAWRVRSADFSPDGRRVVFGTTNGRVWVSKEDGSGQPVDFRGHTDEVNSVSFSPDGRRVVSASDDRTVRVWNSDGSDEPVILKGHADWVWDASFSPDGQRVVSASRDGTVRVWRVAWDLLIAELDGSTHFCLTMAERERLMFESPRQARKGVVRCEKQLAERFQTGANEGRDSASAERSP